MTNDPYVILEPHQDRILSMAVLGERWGIHPKIALNRAKKLNLPIVRFNARSLGVKLSAVLKAELEASVSSVPLATAASKEE